VPFSRSTSRSPIFPTARAASLLVLTDFPRSGAVSLLALVSEVFDLCFQPTDLALDSTESFVHASAGPDPEE
jgi:hypothetical protein